MLSVVSGEPARTEVVSRIAFRLRRLAEKVQHARVCFEGLAVVLRGFRKAWVGARTLGVSDCSHGGALRVSVVSP